MTSPTIDATTEKRRIALLSILMFGFMLSLAFYTGWRSVHDLTWGESVDFHRDMSYMRGILEGHGGEDPTYTGQSMWYTPMLSWVEALAARVTGLPVEEIPIRMGAFLDLLGPIAFFIMVWYFLGPVRAVVCSSIYLFFTIGQEAGWAVATYTPRLMPVTFCQWLFYLEVILIDRAFKSTRVWPSALAGFGAGITFLGHAAPAIMEVLIIALFTLQDVIVSLRAHERDKAWYRSRATLIAALAFILASLPLTRIIVGVYGMNVVNRSAFLYTYYALALRNFGLFLFHNLSVINLFALAGIVLIVRDKRFAMRRVLLAWLVICTILFVYGYTVSVLDTQDGIHLPGLVPTFHFYFYIKAAFAVFAGIAVWKVMSWCYGRLYPAKTEGPATNSRSAMAVFLLIALGISLDFPSYATRRDVHIMRNRGLAFVEANADGIETGRWIHEHLPWESVILCDMEMSLWPVLPTARKVVATANTMGNPYLSREQREGDRDALLRAMSTPANTTDSLLTSYQVTHLLVRANELAAMTEARKWFPHELFRNKGYVLLGR